LVHEAYLRIFGDRAPAFEDRAHFISIASRVMRRLLVDHARARHAVKRGRDFTVVNFDDQSLFSEADWPRLLIVDQALDRLEAVDSRQCRVVEMRYFAGLSEDEIAGALGVSVRTVKRDWEHARAWLHEQLATAAPPSSSA
jgi:RNA polymerase sigma-70 factor, ECF subfamily